MTQIELGQKIGISAPSVSQIVNGNAKPRPVTLTKIIEVLCQTRAEYQNIISSYEGGAYKLREIPGFLEWQPNPEEEESPALRYLNVKAEAITFENQTAEILDEIGLPYKRHFIKENIVADFLIDAPKKSVAIECKFNVERDFDKSQTIASILLKKWQLDKVIIVVPQKTETNQSIPTIPQNIVLLSLGELKEFLGC